MLLTASQEQPPRRSLEHSFLQCHTKHGLDGNDQLLLRFLIITIRACAPLTQLLALLPVFNHIRGFRHIMRWGHSENVPVTL